MNEKAIIILGLFDTSITTAKCLKNIGSKIYGFDYNSKHLGFKSNLMECFLTPNLKEDEIGFLNFIINWLNNKNETFVVIPTSDEFVKFLAKYKSELSVKCKYIVPDFTIVESIINRNQQFDAICKLGINVPEYFVLNENTKSFQLTPPLFIKPLSSPEWKKHYNHKGFVCYDLESVNKSIKSVNTNGLTCIIQKMLLGPVTNNFEVNSLYLPNGQFFSHCIKKIRQYPIDNGTATCIESTLNDYLIDCAKKIIIEMNIVGFSNIEFKYAPEDDKYYFIEVNPRVWLQVNFSKDIGYNFPKMYHDFLSDKKTETAFNNRKNYKWVDFLPDINYYIKYRKKVNLTLTSFLKSWFPFKSTSILSFSDIKPFIASLDFSKKIKRIAR